MFSPWIYRSDLDKPEPEPEPESEWTKTGRVATDADRIQIQGATDAQEKGIAPQPQVPMIL